MRVILKADIMSRHEGISLYGLQFSMCANVRERAHVCVCVCGNCNAYNLSLHLFRFCVSCVSVSYVTYIRHRRAHDQKNSILLCCTIMCTCVLLTLQ